MYVKKNNLKKKNNYDLFKNHSPNTISSEYF